mgnify:CR=1 FL=1
MRLQANTAVSVLDLTATDMGANGSVYIADVLRENLYILDLVSRTFWERDSRVFG